MRRFGPWLLLSLLGLSAAVGALEGAIASDDAVSSPYAFMSGVTPGRGDAATARMLNEALLQAGAHRIPAARGVQTIAEPAFWMGCAHLQDQSRYWEIGRTAYSVDLYLMDHPGEGLRVQGQGSGGRPRFEDGTIDVPSGSIRQNEQLVLSVVQLSLNSVVLRADAMALPRHARCL